MNAEELAQLQLLIDNPSIWKDLHPGLVTRLIQRGVVQTLLLDGSQESIEILHQAILNNPSESMRADSFEALVKLTQQGQLVAKEAVCALVIEKEDPLYQKAAISEGWLPEIPEQQASFLLITSQWDRYDQLDPDQSLLTRVYRDASSPLRTRLLNAAHQADLNEWVLLMNAEASAAESEINALVDGLPRFRKDEQRTLALQLLRNLAEHGNTVAKEGLFRLFLEKDYPPASQLLIEGNLIASDTERQALFLFLTDQWNRYKQIDFNHSLLAHAYDHASRQVRLRIVEQTRKSGRIEWLSGIARGRQTRWLGDMSETDWYYIVSELQREGHYDELWTLAQAGPAEWSARILNILDAASWQPDSRDDLPGYHQLCLMATQLPEIPKLVDSKPMLEDQWPGSSCLAVSPGGKMAAIAGLDHQISIVDVSQHALLDVLPNLDAQIWSLAFNPNADLLASGTSDGQIYLWQLSNGRLAKRLRGHQGLVKGLAFTLDGFTLLSCSFDRTLKVWRLPSLAKQQQMVSENGEILCITTLPNGEEVLVGTGSGAVLGWKVPSGEHISGITGHTDAVISLCLNPDGNLLASGSRDRSILIWSYPEGRLIKSLEDNLAPISQMDIHPNGSLLAAGDLNGIVRLYSFPDGRLVEQFEIGGGAVTGLSFAGHGSWLLTTTKSGPALVWELSKLFILRTAIARMGMIDLQSVEEKLMDTGLPVNERTWLVFLQAVIRWRTRYDIALEEPKRVTAGEFDIEL